MAFCLLREDGKKKKLSSGDEAITGKIACANVFLLFLHIFVVNVALGLQLFFFL